MPFWFWLQWGLNVWVLLPLLTMPFAYTIAQRVLTEDDHDRLLPMSPLAAFLCLAYSLLLAMGIAL